MIISNRFIEAIIEPMIVNQFLEDGGSFIINRGLLNPKASKYINLIASQIKNMIRSYFLNKGSYAKSTSHTHFERSNILRI
jgi:hypothetical protein